MLSVLSKLVVSSSGDEFDELIMGASSSFCCVLATAAMITVEFGCCHALTVAIMHVCYHTLALVLGLHPNLLLHSAHLQQTKTTTT
jgi:hypothetical protein